MYLVDDLRSLDPELYNGLIAVKNFRGNVEDLSLDFTLTQDGKFLSCMTRESQLSAALLLGGCMDRQDILMFMTCRVWKNPNRGIDSGWQQHPSDQCQLHPICLSSGKLSSEHPNRQTMQSFLPWIVNYHRYQMATHV